jgi:hypothetical protein
LALQNKERKPLGPFTETHQPDPTMPGEHVDKIYEAAIAKLTYEGLTGVELAKLSPEAQKLDGAKKKPEVGKEVFGEVESSGLTATEKQEVYQRLVKKGVETELANTTNPATLLRGNNKMSNFMSSYMNEYAKDYLQSISDVAFQEAAKTRLPESLKGKFGRTAFSEIPDVPQEDVAKLHDAYLDISKKVIQASETNLPKLTPEARDFLKAAMEPTLGNEKALNMATASTVLLRGASPLISGPGDQLRLDPESQQVGVLLLGSNVVMQTYANNINLPLDKPLETGKLQNVIAEKLRTEERLGQTSKAYKAISGGSETIDEFVEGLGEGALIEVPEVEVTEKVTALKETAKRLEAQRVEKEKESIRKQQAKELAKQEMEKQVQDKAKVQPDLDKLGKLQTRLEKLRQEKPPLGERFRAFFTKGGIEGLKSEVAASIEKTKLDIVGKVDAVQLGARMDKNKEQLDKLETEQAKLAPGALAYLDGKQKFEQRHGQYAFELLDNGGQPSPKSDRLLEEAGMLKQEMEKHEAAYNKYNELGDAIEQQQEVVDHGTSVSKNGASVGEKQGEGVKQRTKSVRELVGDIGKGNSNRQSLKQSVK